jgi:hypothetical protein
VLDDLAFIVGPPLSVGLSMLLFPEAGPLAAALFLIIGVGLFVVQRRTEPPVSPHAARKKAGLRRCCASLWCARWRCSCWRKASSWA